MDSVELQGAQVKGNEIEHFEQEVATDCLIWAQILPSTTFTATTLQEKRLTLETEKRRKASGMRVPVRSPPSLHIGNLVSSSERCNAHNSFLDVKC